MLRNICNILLAVALLWVLPSGCSKNYSKDDVADAQYSPSILIGTNNHLLYALHPVTGAKNWQVSFANSILACPLVYGGFAYIGTYNPLASTAFCDTLFKVNTKTGKIAKKIWIPGASLFSIKATPIAFGNTIYLCTTNDSVYAIDTGTLKITWRFGADASIESSPTYYNNDFYFATVNGTVYDLDRTTGKLVWSYGAGAAAAFTSSPAVSFPYLYIGGKDSLMYCFYLTSPNAPTGTNKWVFKAGGPIYSSPAVAAGKCIFGCYDNKVYCLDTQTHGVNWIDSTRSNILSSPVVAGNNKYVYIGSNDNNLYALNINDGTVKWRYNTVGFISSSPLVYNGTVYIASNAKYFWALDGETGTLIWNYNISSEMNSSPAVEDFSGVQHNSQVSGFTNWY
jgi:outer membrane protein assembly factor BamB